MNKLNKIFILILTSVTLNNCKKNNPGFISVILQYQTANSSYQKSSTFNAPSFQYPLLPGASAVYEAIGPDSVLLFYQSSLEDISDSVGATIQVTKYFQRSQVDTLSDGLLYPKNVSDFYSVFSVGKMIIMSTDSVYNQMEGVNIGLTIKGKSYSFQDSPGFTIPVPAFKDNSNSFEITKVYYDNFENTTSPSWAYLDYLIPPNETSADKVMVNFNFNCKIYNENPPYDSLIIKNGVFQGFFVDKD